MSPFNFHSMITKKTAPAEEGATTKKAKPAGAQQPKANIRKAPKKTARKRRTKKPPLSTRQMLVWTGLEIFGLAVTTITGALLLIGWLRLRRRLSQKFLSCRPPSP
jgi:hypothetical protein